MYMEEYQVSITARERTVIKNLLERQIRYYQEDIERMKEQKTELCSYSMEIAEHKKQIKKYRDLIKKLYNK